MIDRLVHRHTTVRKGLKGQEVWPKNRKKKFTGRSTVKNLESLAVILCVVILTQYSVCCAPLRRGTFAAPHGEGRPRRKWEEGGMRRRGANVRFVCIVFPFSFSFPFQLSPATAYMFCTLFFAVRCEDRKKGDG